MSFAFLNRLLLDKEHVHIKTNADVYITMTTIPSRMKNTLDIIRHFLKHVTGFKKIILNVPYQYNRWPEFKVSVDKINDPRFMLNRTHDYGPLTKLMGSISIIPPNAITLICDDMCYKLKAFKDIAEKADQYPSQAFSFYVYPYKNTEGINTVKVPQGADLICTSSMNLSHFPSWFQQFKAFHKVEDYFKNECFFVDDQLIGWYFQVHNIPMKQVDRRHRMIYIKNCDVSNKLDNLNRQTGKKQS